MPKEKSRWDKSWDEIRQRRRENEEKKERAEYERSREGDPQAHYYKYRSNRGKSPFS